MKNRYKKSVRAHLGRVRRVERVILEEKDISHIPKVVQKYLRYAKVVGKEKVTSFRAEFKGGIRSKPGEAYMKFHSVQYNFMDETARLFYIDARKKGIPAVGLHLYQDAQAIFQIKILGLFPVVDAKGEKLDQGETVTVFNFISNDRYETDGRVYKHFPWETPISEYREIRGYRIPSKARLIYKYPDTDFCYGEFDLVDFEYNCMELR